MPQLYAMAFEESVFLCVRDLSCVVVPHYVDAGWSVTQC